MAVYEKLPEPVRPDELYEYDANGNRKAFETGKNNQLLSDGVFDYKYDDEGNRIAKVSKNSRTEYFWDHRNRLVRVVDNGKSVEYAYDYQNRLVRRNDELFVHDGWQIACSLKNGKVEHRYLWGATQDELLAVDDMWTLRDHLNTVRKIINAKGAVVSNLEYNAFGALINATGNKPLFRYTGKMFDDATGLQWNINRWYDARVGRWISEDPIGFRAGDGNLFRYVKNLPSSHIDPDGKEGLGLVIVSLVIGGVALLIAVQQYLSCCNPRVHADDEDRRPNTLRCRIACALWGYDDTMVGYYLSEGTLDINAIYKCRRRWGVVWQWKFQGFAGAKPDSCTAECLPGWERFGGGVGIRDRNGDWVGVPTS